MSDRERCKRESEGGFKVSDKNLSSSRKTTTTTTGNPEPFDDGKQADSIRKLSEKAAFLDQELNNNNNNNEILSPEDERSLFKMDSPKRKPQSEANNNTDSNAFANKKPATSEQPKEIRSVFDQPAKGAESPGHSIPTYTSIFAPNSSAYQPRSLPVNQQNAALKGSDNRSKLRKQVAADIESPVDRSPYGKKMTSLSQELSGKNQLSALDDDNEELEDDEIDERLPFSANMTRLRQQRQYKRDLSSPEMVRKYSSPNKHSVLAYENRSEFVPHSNSKQQNAHTKISFNADSRPPSFNTCQSGYDNHTLHHHHRHDDCAQGHAYNDRKFGYHEDQPPAACSRCDCRSSSDYRKFQESTGKEVNDEDKQPKKYSKTKYFHLILKSIILVLLTLLLLMLFVGIILASHYLPQNISRMLNASHTFTVTIA